jgi:hypothetical protein
LLVKVLSLKQVIECRYDTTINLSRSTYGHVKGKRGTHVITP